MSYNAELVPDLLGPGGPLAAALAPYEDRPYQREMALEVARLLEEGGRLAVEAPTGIGKSLGYGVPAALWAADGGGPVVISTHTKALQAQLLDQEAPRLARVAGRALDVRVLKGRSNYLCRRRYEAACREATGDRTIELLRRIRPWVDRTATGALEECGESDPRDLQFLSLFITSDARFCAHSECTPTGGCFFKKARAEAQGADLLVVNHALLSVHLFGGFDLLPSFDALVVDEAHAFVRVALDHLTVSVGPRRMANLMEAVPGGGHLAPDAVRSGEGASRLAALHRALSGVESATRTALGEGNGTRPENDPRQRYRDPDELARLCPNGFEALDDALGLAGADARSLEAFLEREGIEEEGTGGSFLSGTRRFAEEAETARRDLGDLLRPDPHDRDLVYWKEWDDGGFSLASSPLELGPRLSARLEPGPGRVIFTSATLAAGRDFAYFAREIGYEGALPAVAYPSPFAFEEQALAVAVRRGPDPREPGWARATAGTLDALMRDPGRNTMALFTSYRDLRAVAEELRARTDAENNGNDYRILTQRSGRSAARLLESYRRGSRTLLLGTASFWEGVDLPGESLEVLVLTRLPFGVPTDPRFQARAERREAAGENPFTGLYLPEAVLRFKQGFGRLIRRSTDRGIVAVLDPRLLGKGYGKAFAAALPLPLTRVEDGPELALRAARWWREGTPSPQGG